MAELDSTFVKRYSGLLAVILLVALILGAAYPMSVPVKSELKLSDVMGALGAIFVIVLLVERATEIVISIWRQADADAMQQPLRDSTPADRKGKEYKEKAEELERYRATTKEISLFFSFCLSIVVCIAGVGLLPEILEYADVLGRQKSFLRAVDIVLTAGLISGGSDAFHQFTSALEKFFKESKARLEEPREKPKP